VWGWVFENFNTRHFQECEKSGAADPWFQTFQTPKQLMGFMEELTVF
jgi:hypothetical protein